MSVPGRAAVGAEPSDRIVEGRLNALLTGVRVVALDLETCKPKGSPPRVVAVGAVTTRLGARAGQYSTLVDPEAPIDVHTHRVHGIDDDAVVGWPTFSTVAGVLQQLLDPAGEAVVLAAHNVGFDVSVLRSEFDRVGRDLPDVPVLDTANRSLLNALGVRPESRSLPSVGAALGVDVVDHHDALADAQACSRITTELLLLAAHAGYDDLADLLDDTLDGATTAGVSAATHRTGPSRGKHARARRPVGAEHAATHSRVLSDTPDRDELDAWQGELLDCAAQRCPLTVDRVASSRASASVRRMAVEQALQGLLAAREPDAPAVATLLGALASVSDGLKPGRGRLGPRTAAFAWARDWAPLLDLLERCARDACPDCRSGSPCPLDTWREPLAELAFAPSRTEPRGVLEYNGKGRGTGAYTTWRSKGLDRGLADEILAVCVRHHQTSDDERIARTVAQLGWDAGARHPDLAVLVADVRAAPGQPDDLQAAVDLCHTVLATHGDSTATSVQRLRTTSARLAGLLARSRGRDTGRVDDDGNVIYAPRHHPTDPRRAPRPRRFSP